MLFDTLLISITTQLQQKALSITTAESCTGGWLAQVLTSQPGSSAWFERGFITYSNASKQEMLGISSHCLDTFGAVSEETARAMSQGALQHSAADLSIAITGIAGPQGGSLQKPVGMVCFAWATRDTQPQSSTVHFTGDRTSIRQQAVEFALQRIAQLIH